MKIWPRDYTKDTRWVNIEEPITATRELFSAHINMHRRKILLQRPTKQLKPSRVSLFGLLPSEIPADVDICLSGLEHCNKFKHVI